MTTSPGASHRNVVVAGAGIGGLTASLALARRGFQVTILERSDELSVVGAGIQIAPNAARVLNGLGLDAAMAERGTEPPAIEIRDGRTGAELTRVPTGHFREAYGHPYRVIHRADLQALLVEAVKAHPDIELRTGAPVTGFIHSDDRVIARTAKEDTEATALIGADGIWSRLRDDVAPGNRAVSAGRTAWRTVVPADLAAEYLPAAHVGLWLAPDSHLVHYPVEQGRTVNLVAIVEERWDRLGWSAPARAADLERAFVGWTGNVRRLFAEPINWQKFGLNTVDPERPWVKDRVALLGDAAHAMTPFMAQGGAMAIEDAAVLAHHLAGSAPTAEALRAYETERKPRISKLAAASAQTGDIYHLAAGTALARNLVMKAGGWRLVLKRGDWVFRWEPPSACGET